MLALLGIVIGGYLHDWSMQQHLQQSDREIALCDIHKFGESRETAYAMYRMASLHKSTMEKEVQSWNHPEAFGWWERDCERRIRCWSKLDDAFRIGNAMWSYNVGPDGEYQSTVDFANDVAHRLRCLYDLRAMIGKEAFEAGVMPDPFPQYRRLPWK
jgi:hypothetical protein